MTAVWTRTLWTMALRLMIVRGMDGCVVVSTVAHVVET